MIELYDTTLRDGTQREGISFSTEDKLNITKKLAAAGIDYVEGGWPGSNPKDIEYFKKARELNLKGTKIAAFGSTRRPGIRAEADRNLQAIVESGADVATIFGKSWPLHVQEALKTSLAENIKMVASSVKYLKSQGLEVFFDAEHFFDGYKADSDYSIQVLQAAEEAGADCLVLCDTNGGSTPDEISSIIKAVKEKVSVDIGIHTHNDSELAVANSLIAVREGAVQVQGTINGYGERCGNANLSSLIPNLQLKYGYKVVTDKQLKRLTATSRYVSETANLLPPAHMAYVGESAFAHKGGIHVSAVLKNASTYEHEEPELVGNKRRVLVSELSGKSNLRYKAKELGIELDDENEDLQEVLERIKELEHQGYYFEGAEASLKLLLDRARGEYQKLFSLESVRILTDKKETVDPNSEATIKVLVNGERVHTAAEGDGPVNALDKALRKALITFYPEIEEIALVDYKVRVLNGQDGTAAKVRVLIETGNGDETWGTVGVSTNIIEASWQALVDSIQYGIKFKVSKKKEAV